MREFDRLFKRYYNENSPTIKVAKHNKYKNARKLVMFKFKKIERRILTNLFSKIFKEC